MQSDPQYGPVLAAYPDDCRPRQIEYLGAAGGFSGARFWRIAAPRGLLCLRRWPVEHPSVERLQFIQAVLWHVRQEGFLQVPLPVEATSHAGYVQHTGHLWELTPWMPGVADYRVRPSPAKLAAALSTLARFHTAAASFPLPDAGPMVSPGIEDRIGQLEEVVAGRLETLAASINEETGAGLGPRAQRILRLCASPSRNVLATLKNCRSLRVPRQPCIRDIWHDHVLFVGQTVSSLIDFGAMRPESVAADLARLLGSLAGDDADGWVRGFQAYEAVRPLSRAEALLVTAFDRSTVLLSGLNWIQWIFVEGRQFDDPTAVAARLDEILVRLEFLNQREG